MLLGVDDKLHTNLVCGKETLKNSNREKVLGVIIDNKLNHTNSNPLNLTRDQKYMTTDKKSLYFLHLLKRNSLIALYYGCFAQNTVLVELTVYMDDSYALFNKTTPLILKYFFRMQMKNKSTKNA